jgi:hypothetical protein
MSKPFEFGRRLWIESQLIAPPWLQRTVIDSLHQTKRTLRLFSRPYLKIYQWQGQGQDGPLTVVFGGWDDAKPFFKSMLFVEEPVEKEIDWVPIWRLSKLADLPGDLVFIEADRHLVRRFSHQPALIMPPRVQFMLDVRGDWREVELRIFRSVRRHEFRLIRKHGYEYEVSRSDQDFEKFYSEMYLPTMTEKHQELTSLMPLKEAYLYFRHGLLFLVKRDGDWVSGGVCQPQQGIVNFKLIGVKNADKQLIHEGAQAAVYYAVVHWANQAGFEAVNFEGCRSFLSSLFQYKRKWGTSISIPEHQYNQIWIKVQRLTPVVRQFLKDNPCIVIDEEEKLHALIVTDDLDNITPETEANWHKQYMTPGLSGILARSATDLVSTGEQQRQGRNLLVAA